MLAATVRSGEERILAGNGLGPDQPLDNVGVDFDAAVGEKTLKHSALGDGIPDGFGQFGFSRQARQFTVPKREEVLDYGARTLLTDVATVLGFRPSDFIFDLPQRGHRRDGPRRKGRAFIGMQFVEPSPHMRPASREQDHVVATLWFGQAVIGSITIDLQAVVEGRLADPRLAADLRDRRSFVSLAQNECDLALRELRFLHGKSSVRPGTVN